MYSFLVPVHGAVKPAENYEWFQFHGSKPVELSFRGKPVVIKKGMRFGVRPSVNKKDMRLVLPGEETKVITLTLDQAGALAKGVRSGGK
ncbi:hypothetical protein D3C87_1424450 [compost metagenome]